MTFCENCGRPIPAGTDSYPECAPKGRKGCLLHLLIPVGIYLLLTAAAFCLPPMGEAWQRQTNRLEFSLTFGLPFLFYGWGVSLLLWLAGFLVDRKIRREVRAQLSEGGAPAAVRLSHLAGLPLPGGAACTGYICPDRFVFLREGIRYNLDYPKVLEVAVRTGGQLEEECRAGALRERVELFRRVREAVVRCARPKRERGEGPYLVFVYEKEGRPDFLLFGCNNRPEVWKFVQADRQRRLPPASESVSL